MEAHLKVELGSRMGRVIMISPGERCVLGSGPDADEQLDDQGVAAEHCAFDLDDNGLEVTSLDAEKPTLVNGEPLGILSSTSILPRDLIQVGTCLLRAYILGIDLSELEARASTRRLGKGFQPQGYAVEGCLGRGSFGTVYSAIREDDGAAVAIKVLDVALSPRTERFARESEVGLRLRGPHLVSILEAELDHDPPFVVMELVRGPNCKDLLEAGQVPLRRALRIGEGVARGLAQFAEAGVVHRDVKPSNVLIAPGDVAKLGDFGLAKNVDDAVASLTQTGEGLGSLAYMPPEQVNKAKHVTDRADVYGLGATLYHLIGGRLPFLVNTAADLILMLGKDPRPLSELREACSPQLSALVQSMLHKTPERRPSAASVAAALADLAERTDESM